jgi:hypothetical protein
MRTKHMRGRQHKSKRTYKLALWPNFDICIRLIRITAVILATIAVITGSRAAITAEVSLPDLLRPIVR